MLQSSATQTDDQLMRELESALHSRKRPSESSLKKQAYANGAESPRSASSSFHELKEQRRRGSRENRNGAPTHRNGDPYRNDERHSIQYQTETPLQQQQAPPVRRKGSRENYQEEPPFNGLKNQEYYANNHSSPVEVHHAKDDHIEPYRNGEMQHTRLPGMTSSADALVKELQNHPILAKQAVATAVMENERHSPPSSQNSRTESAQDRHDVPLPAPPPRPDPSRRRESDSASRLSKGSRGSQGESPNLSLEADQVSDYDNQQASDLEVNMESEADLHALDVAFGDEHAQHQRGDPQDTIDQDPDTSPVEDSSECESTSSSTGVEQMLFSKLKTNPKVTSLQNMHLLDNSYNEFDNYGQSNYYTDPYAFNPYAIDDDYIKNPLLHGKHPAGLSRHRRHTSLSELQDRLLQHLTDDTDATPV